MSHEEAAQRNRNSILCYVKNFGPISRTEIWETVNISRASVTQVIRQLQESDLIREVGEGESTGGRKPKYLVFNGAARKFYAFDWSSRCLYLMDMAGEVLESAQVEFGEKVTPGAFAARIKEAVSQMDTMKRCSEEAVVGIGLALPGQIDCRSGTVLYSVELGWQNISLRELFADRFGSAVYVERMSNLMALGEYSSRQSRSSHFQLYILGRDGIGVSTIIHGSCQHGANYMHGELGHIKLPGDALCSCGQRGCLEASVKALLDGSGGRITEEILEYLAMGVSTCVNISDASGILLVGSYVEQMTQEQRQQLKESILSKVTSRHMRMLDVRLEPDTRELTRKGIREYLFEKTFPTD